MPAQKSTTKAKPLPPPTPSEAAFERLLQNFDLEQSASQAFVDELFAKADRYLERERYANLGDAVEFNTKLLNLMEPRST